MLACCWLLPRCATTTAARRAPCSRDLPTNSPAILFIAVSWRGLPHSLADRNPLSRRGNRFVRRKPRSLRLRPTNIEKQVGISVTCAQANPGIGPTANDVHLIASKSLDVVARDSRDLRWA